LDKKNSNCQLLIYFIVKKLQIELVSTFNFLWESFFASAYLDLQKGNTFFGQIQKNVAKDLNESLTSISEYGVKTLRLLIRQKLKLSSNNNQSTLSKILNIIYIYTYFFLHQETLITLCMERPGARIRTHEPPLFL